MFLDRQDNRKQIQQAYRKELKSEIDNKRSRITSNKNSQQYHPERESFSLIANIERQQNERKRKNEVYYDDLRNQMQINRKEKQQKQAQKKQRQLEQQNKIKQQQRKLQQRYEEEMKKENKGKRNPAVEVKSDPLPQNIKRKREHSISRQLPQLPKKQAIQSQFKREKSYSAQSPQMNNANFQPKIQLVTSLYPNKIQNETFNYVQRNVYKDNYYKQLLGQRRKLQEETNQISELNRIFNAERYKRREESRGLQELRNLEKMLDSKNAEYLDINIGQGKPSITESGKLKPLNKIQKANIFAPRVNKDEWRKLD